MDRSLSRHRRREPPRKSSSFSRALQRRSLFQTHTPRSLARQSLFVLAAILTLALRPYSFGLLTPRIEALKAEERRLLLLGLQAHNSRGHSTGLDRALGRSGWRGASPTPEEQEKRGQEEGNGNGNGDESDEEDNGFEENLSEGDESEGLAGVAIVRDSALFFPFLPPRVPATGIDYPIHLRCPSDYAFNRPPSPVRSGPPHPRAFAPAAGPGDSLRRCVRSDGPRLRLRMIPVPFAFDTETALFPIYRCFSVSSLPCRQCQCQCHVPIVSVWAWRAEDGQAGDGSRESRR